MSVELLILKSGERYLKTSLAEYELVDLDKASVFSLDQLEQVCEFEQKALEQGFSDLTVKKLVLTEEDL